MCTCTSTDACWLWVQNLKKLGDLDESGFVKTLQRLRKEVKIKDYVKDLR